MMMDFSPKFKLWTGVVLKVLVLVVGIAVLAISMARAGWETRANGDTDEVAGNNLVEFLAVFGDGTTTPGDYKLPETGILPDNMLYGIKEIRNSLWLLFAKGQAKTKMALLLADKSTAEAGKLIEKEETVKAIDAGNEAINKLEYANTLINQVSSVDVQTKQLHFQIFWAGFAYRAVFDRARGSFNLDTEKYATLINRMDDWNKTQEKNRYSWDN